MEKLKVFGWSFRLINNDATLNGYDLTHTFAGELTATSSSMHSSDITLFLVGLTADMAR